MPQVYMASGSMAIGARRVGLLPSAPRLCSWITECLSIVSVMDQSVGRGTDGGSKGIRSVSREGGLDGDSLGEGRGGMGTTWGIR